MRKICLTAFICVVTLAVSGCAVTGEIENQAYALVMGVDLISGGGIELTIRIPRIGQGNAGDGESGGKGEPYLVIAASGDDYAQARENLQWAVARELNLSHLKLLIVSEALASGDRFPELIREIAETRHLYTTAGFIVCEGQARRFIEGQETLLGSHLSDDIDAMFRHYAAHGFIPRATVADLYYATQSCYSDPMGVWGFPDAGEQPASAVIESDESALNAGTQTASSRQYLGAALFQDGRMVGRLNGAETLCLNLLTDLVDDFSFDAGGRTWALASSMSPRISATFDGDRARIRVNVFLTSADQGDLSGVAPAVAEDLERVIDKCQRLRTEPFGFAAKLAARFPTIQEWLAYDWRSRFPETQISVDVKISGPK